MRYIARNKDRFWRLKISQTKASGEAAVPANTAVTLWLSNTLGGVAINAATNVTLTRSATNDRIWTGTMPKADVNTLLAGKVDGDTIYVVVSTGGEIDSAPVLVQFVSRLG